MPYLLYERSINMTGLPPLFVCYVCGLSLRPGDNTVERKAIVWLKSGGKAINRVVEELHEYKHIHCNDRPQTMDVPLF
jgi:hypothetical protein